MRLIKSALKSVDPYEVVRRHVSFDPDSGRVAVSEAPLDEASKYPAGERGSMNQKPLKDEPQLAEREVSDGTSSEESLSEESLKEEKGSEEKGSEENTRVWTLSPDQDVYLLGSGKAAVTMARALEEIFKERIRDGLVIVPQGVAEPMQRIRALEGSHPLPDANSLASTYELIDLATKIPDGSLVFYLLSGGSSALLCRPADELELDDLVATHQLLLTSGANIHEMNVVRTALSSVKGGQLLQYLSHTDLVDLVISDVPGDLLRSIGSGPTTTGTVRFGEAYQVLQRYNLGDRVPESVQRFLNERREVAPDHTVAPHPGPHHQFLISSAGILARRVAAECRRNGYEAEVMSPAYDAPIGEVEKMILSRIHDEVASDRTERPIQDPGSVGTGSAVPEDEGGARSFGLGSTEDGPTPGSDEDGPTPGSSEDGSTPGSAEDGPTPGSAGNKIAGGKCLIWFGESSVNVSGSGKGGRNQELALRIARHLMPGDGVVAASVGTDGVDGPTDAAGAVVSGDTLQIAAGKGLDPQAYLQNNDSYTFFDQTGGLIKTGPTGNNLMDLQVVMIGGGKQR